MELNKSINILATIIAVGVAVILSVKLKHFLDDEEIAKNDFDRVRDFLLGEGDESETLNHSAESTEKRFSSRRKKIPIWIHLPYEINSRKWDSFLDRQNNNLNLPYIHACIQSIIIHCGADFNICLIDDNSFDRLLPGLWRRIAEDINHPNIFRTSFNLITTPEPQRTNLRQLALLELIYRYGGILVPPSFLCFQNLKILINKSQNPFIVENINKGGANQISAKTEFPNELFRSGIGFSPDANFFGCNNKQNTVIKNWINEFHIHLREYGLMSGEIQFS
jgi:hypothetical protein